MGNDIDPVRFGELIGALKELQGQVKILSEKVDHMEGKLTSGRGIIIGILAAAGGAGAFAHDLIGRLL